MRIVQKSPYIVRSRNISGRKVQFWILDRISRRQVGPNYNSSTEANQYMLTLLRNGN